ncbi:LPXTG cell wall anchor domain-containing protein [Streptomyces sp. R21]|uniref:LPXTG cell wall anchor domain-containing protein n=1 Tax=Streptomyces sp. R21 TaxID=3238627 RepID=A0AB39PC60_9ACTN
MRTLTRAGALVAGVSAALLMAPAAAHATAPGGDNGTVKIHDAKTGAELREKGAAKHKVFWTDCEDSQGGGGSTPSASASVSSSPSAQGGGDLAETGSSAPVGALSAAAAALVAAGGYLVFRRRKASQG